MHETELEKSEPAQEAPEAEKKEKTKEELRAQTKAAREAAALVAEESNPRERGREKDLLALEWIYRWGFSGATIIDAFASPSRRGVAARLASDKRKLITGWPCEAAGGLPGIPDQVFTLTNHGLEKIEGQLTEEHFLVYPRDPYKLIVWNKLRHDLLVQKYTIERLHKGTINGFLTPREIDQQSKPGEKQPDAVWFSEEFGKIAVELELTIKHGRDLDQTMRAVIKCVKPPTNLKDGHQTEPGGPYDQVWYLCGTGEIKKSYQKAYTPGREFSLWERHPKTQNWTRNKFKVMTVPDWVDECIGFEEVVVEKKKRKRRAVPGSVLR